MQIQVSDLLHKHKIKLCNIFCDLEQKMSEINRETLKKTNASFAKVTKSLQWEACCSLGFSLASGGVAIGSGFIPKIAPAYPHLPAIQHVANTFIPTLGRFPEKLLNANTTKWSNRGSIEQSILYQQGKEDRAKIEQSRSSFEEKLSNLSRLEHEAYRRT